VSSESHSCRSGGGAALAAELPPSRTTSGLSGQCDDQEAVREDGERSPIGASAVNAGAAGNCVFSVNAPTFKIFQACAGDWIIVIMITVIEIGTSTEGEIVGVAGPVQIVLTYIVWRNGSPAR
jgi:hypothetical protein